MLTQNSFVRCWSVIVALWIMAHERPADDRISKNEVTTVTMATIPKSLGFSSRASTARLPTRMNRPVPWPINLAKPPRIAYSLRLSIELARVYPPAIGLELRSPAVTPAD